MAYYEGFIVPVPKANREAYRRHAADGAPLFHEFGATRHIEAWASDVPDGKVTDFRMAVNARDDEDVVFAWFEYPDKATRDSANEKMRSDPRTKEMSENIPFDAKRMIYGGFDGVVEVGDEHGGYIDGFITPVPESNLGAYRDMAQSVSKLFLEHGALRDVEAVSDDVPKGEVTDFYRAAKSEDGEKVFFSFLEWKDKQTRDEAWKKIMEDERMKPPGDMPFDGKRMFWGGFEPILDSSKAAQAEPTRA